MDMQNKDMAKQVWQRVQENSPSLQERQTLQHLMGQLEADAAYARKKGSATLGEQLEQQILALRGIQALSTGNPPGGTPRSQPTQNWRQCYDHALKRLKEYLLRSADPQFSPVYTCLAEQTKAHCCLIAQLAGKQGKQHSR
jgi:hypothetical protein